MEWADPDREVQVATAKRVLLLRVLKELSDRIKPGPLLDFGCNFGQFMIMAREAGWKPVGFEPNVGAVARAREKGFDVRSGWLLENAGFAEGSFNAITAIDVFCLVSDPIATVRTFHRLLKPGGVLAMRLTNKHFILGLLRASCLPGSKRDARITSVLLPQFHSIGIGALTRILNEVGFDRIQALPNATTAPWNALTWKTRTAYLSASVLYYLSLRTVNISPGVLFFARNSIASHHNRNTFSLSATM
jgi:SAM-dependent methyltransferase